ncbi:alkaline phosphatase [Zobellia russellii]|uniref:alkaline phosphatase n=1 Tax=Zobellia russellii TaxID=248907 RepID=UPI001BFF99E3|nr:alkaline phosphatase [Zobellia russellii]MBT9187365.1 alkaline phosphatase [Zobellia russellii]
MYRFKTKYSLLLALFCITFLNAQHSRKTLIHSHNDYLQNVPFWKAYSNGLDILEADIFLKNGQLNVTHTEAEITKGRTLRTLYLDPLKYAIENNIGNPTNLTLMLDIKSDAKPTLKKILAELKKYPEIISRPDIKIVISGHRPNANTYDSYPNYLYFDHQKLESDLDTSDWEKVAFISVDFKNYSEWNGKGRLTQEDYKSVSEAIKKAHNLSKPFRFWGTPDSKTAWKAFSDLGVDIINTDMPYKCPTYLNSLEKRTYKNILSSEVYRPTYATDQKDTLIKNVILLIGDGNGLNQISSAVLANGGELTLSQLKSIGFLKTQSSDDFTTDSAAAGTALATGVKTYNRAIGLDPERKPVENMPEYFSKYNFVSGIITTDHVTGATPASFYAHQKDRSDTELIASDLLKSDLSLFVGGGAKDFKFDWKKTEFNILNKIDEIGKDQSEKIGHFLSEKGVPGVLEGRGNALAIATKNGIEFLNSKDKPFFLMVEAAQIDSNGHYNNVGGIVTEGIDFDRAITEAIKFADTSGNTLVIITADHETSGFSIPQGNLEEGIIEGTFTTYDHTATMVPVFAYGPGSQLFQGTYENNHLFEKIKRALNLGDN